VLGPNADVTPPRPPPENIQMLTSGPTAMGAGDATKVPAAASRANDRTKKRNGRVGIWSPTDIFVMTAALCVLLLSIAGLVWLLHG